MKRKAALTFIMVIYLCFFPLIPGSHTQADAAKKFSLTDFHMHMKRQKLADAIIKLIGSDELFGVPMVETNAETIISQIGKTHITKAFVLSGAYIWGMESLTDPSQEYEEVKAENDWTAEQAAKYPDRLIPLFSLNPLKNYALQEMDRCFDELKMPAMKLHFATSNIDLRDPVHLNKVEKVLAHAEIKGIPVLIHLMNNNKDYGPEDAQIFIDEILAKHPDLRVCIAHLGGSGGYNDKVGDIFDTFIKAYKNNKNLNKHNLYFDISSVIVEETIKGYMEATTEDELHRMARQINNWGLDRILWGSDYPINKSAKYLLTTFMKLPLGTRSFIKMINKDVDDFIPNKN
ncbi:MAG: amidohydrolase family protein [Bacillota bacterium]